MRRISKKAQSLVAYAVLLAVVIGALLTMRVFLNRIAQEKYRQSLDVWGEGQQYERGATKGSYSGSSWENKKLKCPEVQVLLDSLEAQVEVIRKRIGVYTEEYEDLQARAAALRERAAEVEEQAARLEAEGLIDEANRLRNSVIPDLIAEAEDLEEKARQKAEKIQDLQEELVRLLEEIEKLKDAYPQCFS